MATVTLGNTIGTYRFISCNSKTSKYWVEVYMNVGKTSSNLAYNVKKVALAADLKARSLDIKISRKSFTVAKAYTYGNIRANPQRGCIASTLISNQ